MIDELPAAVGSALLDLTLQQDASAYLQIGKDGILNDMGGDLEHFDLKGLVPGEPATEQLLFLDGMLPLSDTPLTLAAVELSPDHYADIHLLPEAKRDWAVLIDRNNSLYWRAQAQQKANELNLLRRRLRRLESAPAQSSLAAPAMPAPILYNALGMAVLEQQADGGFQLVGMPPAELTMLCPDAWQTGKDLYPQREFPFLENFITEAEGAWSNAVKPRRSGPWVETDARGGEHALEAIAMLWSGRRLLIIELLGERYEEHRGFLQMGRENALLRNYLEEQVHLRTADIRAREEEIALRLVWAAESRDDGETGAHIRRIGLYSEVLASTIGWDRPSVDDIRIAATMHDIGKIGIPDVVLRKPGPLTAEEFTIMKTHPVIGGRILAGSKSPMLQMAKDIALSHHEKWDGSGYPYGLKGEAIPMASRIVALADVFDALVHERVYKAGMSADTAVEIMAMNRGKQFDPNLFDEFLRQRERFELIAQEQSVMLFEGFRGNP
ncbi:MAG: HD domain-containing protein [Gammaproteobacteria bacterium]|nr:HD domain-containing protein [Gammaproteobacteria bacterium]MCF6363146.1 HD domain-containing protein [Gammaproteobacteria bacterium]